jgi:hypothetical protein
MLGIAMQDKYLHQHPDFEALLRIVGEAKGIEPALIEKDYWIMHCLYGLQLMGLTFELKGGTSLSKGFGIIHRFSEDIDIRIEPPEGMGVKTGRNQDKEAHCASRKQFYDWLSQGIHIDGIQSVQRDEAFDDPKYRSGGIRLNYASLTSTVSGLKEGILLEVGFDDVTPNQPVDISSWAFDYASDKVTVVDNRAKAVQCYHAGYTLVEKLQTVSTKYRKQQAENSFPANFLRHYYDIYCLLAVPEVQAFIGSEAYQAHKAKRFRSGDNPNISANEAFLLQDSATRLLYAKAWQGTAALYYQGQPDFEAMLDRIQKHIDQL